jgi:hypothetical protein
MSIEEAGQLGLRLVAETRAFREATEEYLRGGVPLDGERFAEWGQSFDEILGVSEGLRRQVDRALRDARAGRGQGRSDSTEAAEAYWHPADRYESTPEEPERYGAAGAARRRASDVMVAAAAIDVLLMRELLVLDPDAEYDRADDPLGTSLEETFAEGTLLLDEADSLFGEALAPIRGAATPEANRAALSSTVREIAGQLGERAEPPAHDLAAGLLKAAGGGALDFLSAGQHLDVLSSLEERAKRLAKHAPRLLRAHVAKIVTLRHDSWVSDEAADRAVDWTAHRIGVAPMLYGIAGLDRAVTIATARIEDAPAIGHDEAQQLTADLEMLDAAFAAHMAWLGKSARWLRRGASPLTHLGTLALGPIGPPVIAGAFFVGIAYVAYSLTDSLDARDLGFADHVEGVVALVVRQIAT